MLFLYTQETWMFEEDKDAGQQGKYSTGGSPSSRVGYGMPGRDGAPARRVEEHRALRGVYPRGRTGWGLRGRRLPARVTAPGPHPGEGSDPATKENFRSRLRRE